VAFTGNGVAILCMPAVAQLPATHARVRPSYISHGAVVTAALLAFILAITVMTVLLLRRYKG